MSIITRKKNFDEIIRKIENARGVLILGCDGCAKDSHTGGPEEVYEMAKKLEERGIKVFTLKKPCVYYVCWEKSLEERFNEISSLSGEIDTILLLACGAGISCLNVVLERHGVQLKVVTGTDTLGIGHVPISGPEKVTCWSCGKCELINNKCKLLSLKK